MLAERSTYVIDDDPEMCRSIAMLLAIDGLRCRTFGNGEDFVGALSHLHRGVIITDVALGGMSGIELVDMLAAKGRSDPVIVITGQGDVPMAVRALKAGAIDFIGKPFVAKTLLTAVHEAHARLRAAQAAKDGLGSLSSRERQVLDCIVEGFTSKQMALNLGISPRTVETYRHHLMVKTGATSMSQLIRLAIEGGGHQRSTATSFVGNLNVNE